MEIRIQDAGCFSPIKGHDKDWRNGIIYWGLTIAIISFIKSLDLKGLCEDILQNYTIRDVLTDTSLTTKYYPYVWGQICSILHKIYLKHVTFMRQYFVHKL
jgi:hypothetical protein